MMHSKHSNVLFVDSLGNQYLVRDVPGDGNCALHALLFNPVFEVPLSGVSELRRGDVIAFYELSLLPQGCLN
jgi:prepilin-type processing-associated H-X9-DG protein